MKVKKIPLRMCTGCMEMKPKKELIRVVKSPEGVILRAKGYVPSEGGSWLHFDFVPGEAETRRGSAEVSGRICVIGSQLAEEQLDVLFQKSVR